MSKRSTSGLTGSGKKADRRSGRIVTGWDEARHVLGRMETLAGLLEMAGEHRSLRVGLVREAGRMIHRETVQLRRALATPARRAGEK